MWSSSEHGEATIHHSWDVIPLLRDSATMWAETESVRNPEPRTSLHTMYPLLPSCLPPMFPPERLLWDSKRSHHKKLHYDKIQKRCWETLRSLSTGVLSWGLLSCWHPSTHEDNWPVWGRTGKAQRSFGYDPTSRSNHQSCPTTEWARMDLKGTHMLLVMTTFKHGRRPPVRIPTKELLHGAAGWVWDLYWSIRYLRFDHSTAPSRPLHKQPHS